MDSSVDVCDLMINLLCTTCSDRACAENKSDDQGEPIWSHSKLMDCIKKDFKEKADKIEAIKKYVDHIEYGGHVIRQPDVAEASKMIAQRLREILEAEGHSEA